MSQPTDLHTLAGAYALDALTEIERAGFARHLAACEACATDVAEFQETASRLGAVAWEAPPARLRDAVLAEVARTRQVTAGRAGRAAPTDVQRWRRWTAAAIAAGVLALGGTATVWVVQEQRVREADRQAAQLRDILAAGDVQVRTTTVSGGGKITVAVSASRNDGVVVVSDLPAPPEGKVYQLWLIDESSPRSAGVMAAGQRSGITPLASVRGADTLGVTLEPEGGSPAPTSGPVAGVPLS
jgi:anti-sigma-K factor RskA